MSAPIWNPPAKVANDVASATVAGYAFAWAGMTGGPAGGILNLRVGLRTATLVDLGEHAAAADIAGHLGQVAVDPANDLYVAGCIMAQCVLLAERDNQLSEAHNAIRKWCAQHGHTLAGPSWEIYGHWVHAWCDDPSKIRTDVFYLLKPAGGSAG